MYDGARVSTTIASHTRWRPARHGIIVRPSGLRPSVRSRPGGSFIDGIPAFERERCIMSLIVLCLAIRPKPREQDRPWLPLASIRAPQAHNYVWFTYCGPQAQADRHPNVLVVQSQPTCCYYYSVSYTHLRAHETPEHLVCRL